jgi:hypothetical protein
MATTQETLMGNPITAAFADYAQGQVDQARLRQARQWQLNDEAQRQRDALALLGARTQGEKDIEDMRNAGALERTKASVEGYINRLDQSELGRRALDLQRKGAQQKRGESLQDFVTRGTTDVIKQHQAALDNYDQQLAQLDSAKAAAERTEAGRQNSMANNLAGVAVTKDIDLNMTPAEKQVVLARTGQGFNFDEAVADAAAKGLIDPKRAPVLRGAYITQRNLLLPQIQASRSPEHLRTLEDLDRRQNSITSRRNSLLNTDFGSAAEALRAANPQAQAAITGAYPPSAPNVVVPKPRPSPASPTAGIPTSLMGPLGDEAVFKIVQDVNPQILDTPANPTVAVRSAASMLDQRIADKQRALDTLGVKLGADGQPLIPAAKTNVVGPQLGAGIGGFYLTPPQSVTSPLSINERKRIHKQASGLLDEIQQAKQDRAKLQDALDTLTPASSADTNAPSPRDIFGPPMPTPGSNQTPPAANAPGFPLGPWSMMRGGSAADVFTAPTPGPVAAPVNYSAPGLGQNIDFSRTPPVTNAPANPADVFQGNF